MKIKVPSKTVEVCDACHADGYLQTCLVCNGKFCLSCMGLISRCWVKPDVCRQCAKRADVLKVVEKYAEQITPIIAARENALCKLPKEAKR